MNFKITFYNFSGRYVYAEHSNSHLAYAIEAKTNWLLVNLRNVFPVFNAKNEDYIEFCQMHQINPIFPSDILGDTPSGVPVFNGQEISYFFYNQDFTEAHKNLFFNIFKGWSFNGNFNRLVLTGTEDELDRFQRSKIQVVMEPRPLRVGNEINTNSIVQENSQATKLLNESSKELELTSVETNSEKNKPENKPLPLDYSSKLQINIYED